MCLWNARVATVAIAVILCCGHVLARTWTDSTGAHKIEGEFVKLADGKVDIRRDDGKLVRIPLNKLSEADQRFCRRRPGIGPVWRPELSQLSGALVAEAGYRQVRDRNSEVVEQIAGRAVAAPAVDGSRLVKPGARRIATVVMLGEKKDGEGRALQIELAAGHARTVRTRNPMNHVRKA